MNKILFAILSLIMLFSCVQKRGSGNIITQNKSTGPFTALNVAGNFEVEIAHAATESVRIQADDNLLKYIDVKVTGGELKIRLNEINTSNAHLKIFITAPEINKIKASASADILVRDVLKSGAEISMEVSSGADIKAALDAPAIKATASSGGEVNLSGRTKDFTATSSSGSSINAKELLSENSTVNVSSGASAHVYASMNLDANASSGGNISYRGAAASIKKSESSGGDVEKEN